MRAEIERQRFAAVQQAQRDAYQQAMATQRWAIPTDQSEQMRKLIDAYKIGSEWDPFGETEADKRRKKTEAEKRAKAKAKKDARTLGKFLRMGLKH